MCDRNDFRRRLYGEIRYAMHDYGPSVISDVLDILTEACCDADLGGAEARSNAAVTSSPFLIALLRREAQ